MTLSSKRDATEGGLPSSAHGGRSHITIPAQTKTGYPSRKGTPLVADPALERLPLSSYVYGPLIGLRGNNLRRL